MRGFLDLTLSNALMAIGLAVVALLASWRLQRPMLRHTLWLLVLLKLVTPPLFHVLEKPVPIAVAEPATQMAGMGLVDPGSEQESVGSLLAARGALQALLHEAELDAGTSASWLPRGFWLGAISAIWLAGGVFFLGLALVRVARFQRLLSFGEEAPPELQAQADELGRRLGLRRLPLVWLVPGRVSPLLWGLGRRLRLVVPRELLVDLNAEQVSTLLAHELAHARRGDYLIRWLELAVLGWYWWHPIAWYARRELQDAEEQCCDAWVVWLLPGSAKAYAKALLQTVDFLDRSPALPPVASGMGHLQDLKRRVNVITREKGNPRLSWPVHLGAVALGLAALTLTPPKLPAASLLWVDEGQKSTQKRDDIEARLQAVEAKLREAMKSLEEEKQARARERSVLERELAQAKDLLKQREAKQGESPKWRVEQDAKGKIDVKVPQWKFDFKWDGNIDEKQMKDLEKHLQEAMKKHLSPEHQEHLQKMIHAKIQEHLSPEKMKDMEKKIQEAMKKGMSPEKMEEVHKKIHEAVEKAMKLHGADAELPGKHLKGLEKQKGANKSQADQEKKTAEEQHRRAIDHAAAAEKRAKELAEASKKRAQEAHERAMRDVRGAQERARADAQRQQAERESQRQQSGARDLERRLDRLEQQIDKLTRALESKDKQKE